MEQTAGQIETMPVLMVITHRPEYRPPFVSQTHASALALNRLGRGQVADMVRDVAGKAADTIVDQVVARAEGIPLFVEELTKSVVEAGYKTTDIPETLQASLRARLDRLGPAMELAQIGAVIGREFNYGLVSAVANTSAEELDNALKHLVESQLLFQRGEPPDATYVFKHALVQDEAYNSLLRRRRREVHQTIAEALEERFPEITRAEPEVVAHHFSKAELPDGAIAYWRRAGELASSRSANIEAEAHIKRGLELIKQLPAGRERDQAELELLILLGPVLMSLQGWASDEVGSVLCAGRRVVSEFRGPRARFHRCMGSLDISAAIRTGKNSH